MDEKLLKTTVRDSLAPSSLACVDAERLAAWSDGTLPPVEARAVEAHLAGCAHCQAMLAAFARSEPALPVGAAAALPRRWSLRWLVPLTAAAAALLVWIAVPENPAEEVVPSPAGERPERTMARAEPQPEMAPVPPSPDDTRTESPASGSPRPATERPASDDAARQGERDSSGRQAQAPSPPRLRSGDASPAAPAGGVMVDEIAPSAAPGPVNQPAPAAPSLPAAAPPPPAPVAAAGRADAKAEAPTQVQGERSFNVMRQPATMVEIVASTAASSPATGSTAGGAGRAGRAAALSRTRPSGTPMRWRIVAGSRLERSTDGGATWEPLAIDPGVQLTGGSSPSATVCWLIGRAGVVLRTTDGARFDRVTVPVAADLSTVTATSPQQATVTTADGRTFTTTDGGVSWRALLP